MYRAVKRVAAPAVSLAVLAGLVLFLPVDAVTIRMPREANLLIDAVRVVPGSEIRLGYRHSVEKTMVEGVFTIGPGPVMQALETRMTSVGTGLPNVHTERTRRVGQWLVVDEQLATIPGFDFFISAVNTPRLTVDGTAIAVQALASGSLIHLDVERVRLSDWMVWRYGHRDWRKEQQ